MRVECEQPLIDTSGVDVLDPRDLVERLQRATGLSAAEVVERLQSEADDMGSTVHRELAERGIEPHVWSDGLVEFYRSSNAMFFETVIWNRTELKQGMRQWILDFLERDQQQEVDPLRLLTFGDGLGFDSLALAQAGHEVDYYEVSETCIRFAGGMFADAGAAVKMLDSPEDLVAGCYDAIVCLDVLEHIPDPREVVEFLVRALRPGGRLIVHAPFYYLSPAVETHLRCNRKYSGELKRLYGRFGLRAIDSDWFWNPVVLEKVGATPTRRSLAARVRLWGGKAMLVCGRYWSAPHQAVGKWLASGEQENWQEMVADLRPRRTTEK